jgi:hypothetical protein
MNLPTWLKDRLGAPTYRGVQAHRCPHCHGHILTGYDEDWTALKVDVDPTPLTALGEAMALLDNRGSYHLRTYKTGFALWRRDHWQIAGSRNYPRGDVVTRHECGKPLHQFQTDSTFADQKIEEKDSDVCPF